MILLDTDHVTLLKYHNNERTARLLDRIQDAQDVGEIIGTTIVSVEEQMRGWLSALAKEKKSRRMIAPYRELQELFEFFDAFVIAPFNEAAADWFDQVRGVPIKVSDRKIAAVCLAHDALLLTANRRDFERIPHLRFENWLD
jgi:tRNA(fMet)-specific endonuclease VapC